MGIINWFCERWLTNDQVLTDFEDYQRRMDQFVGHNMETVISPEMHDGEAKVVLLRYDESFFEAHDGKRFVWLESEKNL